MSPETIIAAVIGFAGVVFTQYLQFRKWKRELHEREVAIKREMRTEHQKEMARDHERIELARIGIVQDAQQMVDRYEQAEALARERLMECEKEHRITRDEMQQLNGRMEELRIRFTEVERTHNKVSMDREKDRIIKHDAMTALTISEMAMSTVSQLAPRCTCAVLDPIKSLIENWKPSHRELMAQNAMSTGEWFKMREQMYEQEMVDEQS